MAGHRTSVAGVRVAHVVEDAGPLVDTDHHAAPGADHGVGDVVHDADRHGDARHPASDHQRAFGADALDEVAERVRRGLGAVAQRVDGDLLTVELHPDVGGVAVGLVGSDEHRCVRHDGVRGAVAVRDEPRAAARGVEDPPPAARAERGGASDDLRPGLVVDGELQRNLEVHGAGELVDLAHQAQQRTAPPVGKLDVLPGFDAPSRHRGRSATPDALQVLHACLQMYEHCRWCPAAYEIYYIIKNTKKQEKHPSFDACLSGGSSQTRTGDTRLFRPLLYQLS